MKYQVKICGITNIGDALAAVDAGAHYIGLIFVESSPRHISPPAAAQIAAQLQGTGCQIVGVFQNATREEIEAVQALVPLDYVQLHGQETAELCRQVAPSIKAVTTVEEALSFGGAAELILIDRPKSNADPHFLDALADHLELPAIPPFLLAGGLNPQNLEASIEKFKDCPTLLGFDVASGVEATPGQKDIDKIKQFCQIAGAGGRHANRR